MRWFIDTEFQDLGNTIDLISIAVVSGSGHEYYAVSNEYRPGKCDEWVKANVLAKLPTDPALIKSRSEIAYDLRNLIGFVDKSPVFWAYFADYDWVNLCQLFGGMLRLPNGWPQYCMDLKQRMVETGVSKKDLPVQDPDTAHDALADARWVRDSLLWIEMRYAIA